MNLNHEKLYLPNGVKIYCGDCLDILPILQEQGLRADMVLTDLPFGTTHCHWDTALDLPQMWEGLRKVITPSTPLLLFAQQPYTTILGASNLQELRYSWIWEKTLGTGYLNARRMPLKCHEDILVFYRRLPKYRPVLSQGHTRKVVLCSHRKRDNRNELYNRHENIRDYSSTERFPRSVMKFKSDKQLCSLHPTQKPVALLEYLIRNYSDEGDTILDFTMGSGSTGIACLRTHRQFIGIEKDPEIFKTARNRLIQETNK